MVVEGSAATVTAVSAAPSCQLNTSPPLRRRHVNSRLSHNNMARVPAIFYVVCVLITEKVLSNKTRNVLILLGKSYLSC